MDIVAVASGANHTLYLHADGTVSSNGDNTYGQLGHSISVPQVIDIIKIPNLTDIIQIAAAGNHSLFLKRDGTVWGCGASNSGALHPAWTESTIVVSQIPDVADVRFITTTNTRSFFVQIDGNVIGHGVLTTGNTPPSRRSFDTNDVISISTSLNHTLFLHTNGRVSGFGGNTYQQLEGLTPIVINPIYLSGITNVVQVYASLTSSLFLLMDGSVWVKGSTPSLRISLKPSVPRKVLDRNVIWITSNLNNIYVLMRDSTLSIVSRGNVAMNVLSVSFENEITTILNADGTVSQML